MSRRIDRRRRKGFTLLELMLVMAILVILASLGTVAVLNLRKGADTDATVSQISTLAQSCKAFKLHMGYFPASLNDLLQPPTNAGNKWRGPYIDNVQQVPLDSWGNAFTYTPDDATNQVMISSAGPDRQSGTADDVSNAANIR